MRLQDKAHSSDSRLFAGISAHSCYFYCLVFLECRLLLFLGKPTMFSFYYTVWLVLAHGLMHIRICYSPCVLFFATESRAKVELVVVVFRERIQSQRRAPTSCIRSRSSDK
ncbi:hypothetical protein S245_010024 [Arachis hypogaea]